MRANAPNRVLDEALARARHAHDERRGGAAGQRRRCVKEIRVRDTRQSERDEIDEIDEIDERRMKEEVKD